MVGSCCAYNCTNRYGKLREDGSKLPFHRFPHHDPILLKKWILAVKRKDWQPVRTTLICGEHFIKDDYKAPTKRNLKNNVVPSVFNFQNHLQTAKKSCPKYSPLPHLAQVGPCVTLALDKSKKLPTNQLLPHRLSLTVSRHSLALVLPLYQKINQPLPPVLENICWFNVCDILQPDIVMEIFEKFGLFPTRYPFPPCKICCGLMVDVEDKTREMGWHWKCADCNVTVNPLENTFFENVKISFRDVLMIIVVFAWGMEFNTALKHINEFNKFEKEQVLSSATLNDFYQHLREVSEICASNGLRGRLDKKLPPPKQLANLLEDIAAVYPGYYKQGLIRIDEPTPQSEDHWMSKKRKLKSSLGCITQAVSRGQ